MAAKPRKVLVFGMDGADWQVLQPLIDSGRAPTLARLQREGVSGPLASTIHPHSPTAWSSFLTGMNPGKHGIFDFTKRKKGSYDTEVVSTRTRGGQAIWKILSQAGIRCGVMNVPMTYPPEKVAGFFVAGVFTSEPLANFTYPSDVLDDMKKVLGHPYLVEAVRPEFSASADVPDTQVLAKFLEEMKRCENERTDATLHLIQRFNTRYVVHVDISTDRAQHSFWRYWDKTHPLHEPDSPLADAINQTYITADANLGRLWKAMGEEETTVLVLSDHGGGPFYRVMLINQWLEREGYLATVRPAAMSSRGLMKSVMRSAYQLAKKVLPKSVRTQIAGRVDVGRQNTVRLMRQAEVDYANTRAFTEGTFGNIVLNVRGREPQGTVAPGEEYEALRREMRAKLEAVIDPETGRNAITKTWNREELYSGDRIDIAPDIVAEMAVGYRVVGDFAAVHRGGAAKLPEGVVFASGRANPYKISGIHGPDGIFLAGGPGVARGLRVAQAHIYDLAPTTLALFGLPVPKEMDGTVIEGISSP